MATQAKHVIADKFYREKRGGCIFFDKKIVRMQKIC